MTKANLKNKAIQLRKNGKSYSEILKNIPVAKSTLSLWLRSVSLTKRQKQKLTFKKLQACWRGGQVKKEDRIKRKIKIIERAKNDIDEISRRDLMLLGTMLYWAEGSKEKEYYPGIGVVFGNSDVKMIKLYLKWLKDCLMVSNDEITFGIYIHETYKDNLETLRSFWSKNTGFPINFFDKVYFKKNKLNGNRKNKGLEYNGLLRVTVKKSSNLNRKIVGWIEGVCKQCGIV